MAKSSQRSGIGLQAVYYALSYVLPKSTLRFLQKQLAFGGVKQEAQIWFGQVFLLSLLCGTIAFLSFWIILRIIAPLLLLLYGVTAAFLVLAAFYVHLLLKIDDRKNRLEVALPDALNIIASNLRAGTTPLVALRLAARPEFGPLEEEIKYATTKSLGTESFTDALNQMAQNTNSAVFQRIVALFNASLKAGGKLASLLENTAQDALETQQLKSELNSNLRVFSIFIIFTVIVGTPLLLSVSGKFVSIVSGLQHQNVRQLGGAGAEAGLPGLVKAPFSLSFIQNVSLVVIVLNSILVSALLGALQQGKASSGLKYAPFILLASLVVYFFMREYALKVLVPL